MTTAEKQWRRRQKLARDLDKIKRQTGCSLNQLAQFTGVSAPLLSEYTRVARTPKEETYAKLYKVINDPTEFKEFITPKRRRCKVCGVDIGTNPNAQYCPECYEVHARKKAQEYREKKRMEKAERAKERPEDRARRLAEKRMFKGMSDNMRKISAIEVEARKHDGHYGRWSAIYDGRL